MATMALSRTRAIVTRFVPRQPPLPVGFRRSYPHRHAPGSRLAPNRAPVRFADAVSHLAQESADDCRLFDGERCWREQQHALPPTAEPAVDRWIKGRELGRERVGIAAGY